MRIISGKYRGKKIGGYDIDGTRPTMDSVKESMFAMIQEQIHGICLDLFAGSGSLGLEALSNGCDICYFVDSNIKCTKLINNTLKELNISTSKVLNMDYRKALSYFKDNNIKFDLVLLDPPYSMVVINKVIDYLVDNELLNDNGTILCEMESNLEESSRLSLIKKRIYGSKTVYIYNL